jgi:hypothetical protein
MKIDKSIRILTFHSAYSYGAVLQTFALYSYLNRRYTDVKVIDFRPKYFSLGIVLSSPKTWLIYSKFSRFLRKIVMTKEYTAEELRQSPPDADVFIIGSDQVWNPDITKDVKDIYFGAFIPKNRTKITYAASFGRTEFSENEKKDFIKYVHDFNAISCREESGVAICRDVLGVSAECVIDPVFLIDKDYYRTLFNLNKIKDELCLFVLNNSSTDCFDCAKSIANSMNLSPKVLNKNKRVDGLKIVPFPSIKRFVSEIYSSKFVITNSFHGLAFSIIMEKDFAFVCTDPSKGTRAINLLEKLGLMNRFFNSYEELQNSTIGKEHVNYNDVNAKKEILRQNAFVFLESNIK